MTWDNPQDYLEAFVCALLTALIIMGLHDGLEIFRIHRRQKKLEAIFNKHKRDGSDIG